MSSLRISKPGNVKRSSSAPKKRRAGVSGVAQTSQPPIITVGHGAPPGIGPTPGSKPIIVESEPGVERMMTPQPQPESDAKV